MNLGSHNKTLKQWPQSATIYLLSRNTANFDRMKTDTLLQISSSRFSSPLYCCQSHVQKLPAAVLHVELVFFCKIMHRFGAQVH